ARSCRGLGLQLAQLAQGLDVVVHGPRARGPSRRTGDALIALPVLLALFQLVKTLFKAVETLSISGCHIHSPIVRCPPRLDGGRPRRRRDPAPRDGRHPRAPALAPRADAARRGSGWPRCFEGLSRHPSPRARVRRWPARGGRLLIGTLRTSLSQSAPVQPPA